MGGILTCTCLKDSLYFEALPSSDVEERAVPIDTFVLRCYVRKISCVSAGVVYIEQEGRHFVNGERMVHNCKAGRT